MTPKIIQNGEFIEVIGHYDDKVLCAKMTLLADLYAVEHNEGYAKFKVDDKDKLRALDEKLEFIPVSNFHGMGLDTSIYLWGKGFDEDTFQIFHNYDTSEINYDIGTTDASHLFMATWVVGGNFKLSSSQTEIIPLDGYRIISVVGDNGNVGTLTGDTEFSVPETADQYTITVVPTTSTKLTFDLSTLGLASGTHRVKVWPKGDDVNYSDADLALCKEVEYRVGGTGETWVINEVPTTPPIDEDIVFVSNNEPYTNITIISAPPSRGGGIYYGDNWVYSGGWSSEAYRTVTFDTAPTGTLLAWLEVSAVKMPSKGDLIEIENERYRVLDVNGATAKVFGLFDAVETSFDSGNDNTYNGSDLDVALNTTWFEQQSEDFQAAVVDSTIKQYSYEFSDAEPTSWTYKYDWAWDPSGPDYLILRSSSADLTRKVYALDIADYYEYHESNSTTSNDLMMFFFEGAGEQGEYIAAYLWLRSANSDDTYTAYYVNGEFGVLDSVDAYESIAARPAFKIDLSKITWTPAN